MTALILLLGGCGHSRQDAAPTPQRVELARATTGPALPVIRVNGTLALKNQVPLSFKVGGIIAKFEAAGLRIVAQKMIRMSEAQAGDFYGVHRAKPFFGELVEFMTYGPVVVQVLEGENAVAKYRDVMGATNPANAAPGTIRKDFAESIEANSVHGSDSPDNAKIEIAFFFSGIEIVG